VIFSLGKKLTVQEVAVEGLAVQVARLPDGRLNLQDIADKLPRSEEKPSEPIDEDTRQKIRAAKVEQLRLSDGRVRFVDLASRGAPGRGDRRSGRHAGDVSLAECPSRVKVAAAVPGGEAEISTWTPSWAPRRTCRGRSPRRRWRRRRIKLEPTPLRPLAPFLASVAAPELAELTDGTLAMDLNAVPAGPAPVATGRRR
jgi:hypothetical protein